MGSEDYGAWLWNEQDSQAPCDLLLRGLVEEMKEQSGVNVRCPYTVDLQW